MPAKAVSVGPVEDNFTAVWLKRFFRVTFGHRVLVTTSKHYINVRQQRSHHDPLKFENLFPPEFGNLCMRAVYAKHEGLCSQDWGGNISPNMIAMRRDEWLKVIRVIQQR